MEKIASRDGTVIAYDRVGVGPPVVVVAGASCDRGAQATLAGALARHMTVLNYDRRGRGDSGDTAPYAVDRELEDIRALVDAAGGRASLLGLSSGAVLAARAAADGVPVGRLVLWEPPFSVDAEGRRRARAYAARLRELLAHDQRGDALALFLRQVGLSEAAIAGRRRSPYWESGVALAHTLAYDAAVMADSTPPTGVLAQIGAPTLVLAGSRSPEPLRRAAERATASIPDSRHQVLADQDHHVDPEAIALVVARFAGAAARA
ncbi:alpha/beta hydrolase [Streptomyces sp. AC563]|uniref:alpha/beta fold hydrolase n=1 Tax=Streptomyces buecherae TaxID=2763006 RepID=UPI00164DD44B|nr:alpha/beta hydrolase [Streptomyces buecherae]MBC3990080.1 alpha/beta hydrolase [Streptomyces buecherae]